MRRSWPTRVYGAIKSLLTKLKIPFVSEYIILPSLVLTRRVVYKNHYCTYCTNPKEIKKFKVTSGMSSKENIRI